MMAQTVRIEITENSHDPSRDRRLIAARDFLGVHLTGLEEIKVYKIAAETKLPDNDALQSVFADPVLQTLHTDKMGPAEKQPAFAVEVSFRPGVTDNPARAAETALALTGHTAHVASSSLFLLYGDIKESDAQSVGAELLANDLIQKIDVYVFAEFLNQPRFENVCL
ncbi:MAG TPA: hypothetical protein VHP34_03075, partial [Alphaproteobacteria bacterium]|nr:hypothetical protein [Alphaproteobacteria bacterium]